MEPTVALAVYAACGTVALVCAVVRLRDTCLRAQTASLRDRGEYVPLVQRGM